MDAPNISKKRKFDDRDLSLNDANVSEGSEGVNKNLLKCLVGLTKHIIDVHKNKHDAVRHDTHTVIKLEDEGSSEIDVTEQPHFHIPLNDSLSKNISLLKEQTAELEKIYNTPQYNSSRDSLNQTNYTTIDNLLRANVVQHLSENSANLTEQICNLISMYKSEESAENSRNIRKCLSKINKKIKSIPLQSDVIRETQKCTESDVFFSSFNKSNLSKETNAYLTAAHNLSDKLSVLIKKVSKLKKIYKKRVLNLNKSEPVVKKRKLFNISNNESIVIDNNDNTFNNTAGKNLLEINCSTPNIVKNANQITNNSELTRISIVTNEKLIGSLDKSILEPYNSNYVNKLLDSYSAIANNAKLKRKSKGKSENIETIVHKEIADKVKTKKKTKTTDNNKIQDVVIKIESDDNSEEIIAEQIMKKKSKTVHDVLVQNNENVIEESPKKIVKKKKKTAENSNEYTQEILIEINENNTETAFEERSKKTVKKKRKSVENSTENVQEILTEVNENNTETAFEEKSKKTVKKKKKSVENSNDNSENTQEISVLYNENSVETVSEENSEKIGKKKKKSVENSNDNNSENTPKKFIKNKDNFTEMLPGKISKKTVKNKRKSVENSDENNSENTQEILVQNNENSAGTVSEENPKKTVKKKRKSVENSSEDCSVNTQGIFVLNNENVIETLCEETPKETVKKKIKSVENSTENTQKTLIEVNDNSTETVSEETPKKTVKKKKKFVENSNENTQEIVAENNETSLNVNNEKTRRKKLKKKKNSDGGITENILNDILHDICAHIVQDNENESAIERNNEIEVASAMKKCRKGERNKENVFVIEDSMQNPTKVKRKKKIMTDASNVEGKEILDKNIENDRIIGKKMSNTRISCMEKFGDDDSKIIMEKKKRKSAKKTRKSAEFIVESSEESETETSVQNNDIETTPSLLRQKKNRNGNKNEVLMENNDIETSVLVRKKKHKNIDENSTENNENDRETNNEHFLKKNRKKKKKSAEIIDEPSREVSFNNNENTIEVASEENLKKKVKKNINLEENSERAILVENREINCKRKGKKTKKSTESRNGNSTENMETILVEKNEASGNVNDEITSKNKLNQTMENIKWENVSVEKGSNNTTNNDIILKRRSKSFSENMDRENVPKSEELSAKLPEKRNGKRTVLETAVTNSEISDDIFSSVFKIEPLDDDDDDDLQRDFNVNFVPLNGCLQDEDLDEKEQYLYLRELVGTAKEKMKLSEETKDRLRSLCVLLDFDVPAAHTIENNLCKGPSREQAQQMAALGVKTGPITRDEDDIIRRNWASFYKTHDLPNDPMPFLTLQHGREKIISYEDRRKFVQYLGKDLAHRALHSIYRRFKILFKVTKDGRFSQDEDMLILSYVKFSGQTAKFADLMPVLNRPRAAIEARYRVLKKSLTKVSWDLNLKAELIKHMKQVLEVEHVSELQHADITHAHLAEVAKRMNLPVVKIRRQWCMKLYTQLFAAKPLYLDQMKVDLVDRLYELKIADWRKVNWCEVGKPFPGVSPVSLRTLMKTLYRHNCPKKLQADLAAIINHCRTILVPELKSRPDFNQRYIYRLKLNKDGSLTEYV